MMTIENTSESTAPVPSPPELTAAEKSALLERIVGSPQFRRATRLREFLVFVGLQSIQNSAASIHEQEIGAAVFERPTSYDTGADNIVRVNATELRKRLELYFSTDGADEPVVVEMPRGFYTLSFHPRVAPPPLKLQATEEPAVVPSTEAESTQPTPPSLVNLPSRRQRLWQALALLLCFVSAGLLWQNLHLRKQLTPWREGSALSSFWSEFFDRGKDVDIVLADTSFALAQDIEHRSIPLAAYLNYDYKRVDNIAGLSADRRADLESALDRNNGSAGDFIVAQRIIDLDRSDPSLRLKFAREYDSEAIKANSVVLIGSRQSNPWVELFSARMNFSLDYDPESHSSIVHNRQPKPGEEAEYSRLGGASHNEGLSIIAFMPDLSRTGSALIIEGTDSQATRAAGEFVTSDATLSMFLSRIDARSFPYFEILLENSQLTGTPLRSQILAYRTYPRNKGGAIGDSNHSE